MDEDELLISKPEVFLYNIPPAQNNADAEGNQRAAKWDIPHPLWHGKLLIYKADPYCHVELDDSEGNVYGQAVIDEYPGSTLKPTVDSSRYFTLNMQNKEGKFLLVGLGFANRSDSSEITKSLANYFAPELRQKRKLNLESPSPPKKLKSQHAYSIYAQTKDPDYKYLSGLMFKCHECPLKFNCPDETVTHWKESHNLKRARLCLCNLPFPFKGERRSHTQKFHPNIFTCDICHLDFLTKIELAEHFLAHSSKSEVLSIYALTNDPDYKYISGLLFKCHECSQKFSDPEDIVDHWKESHQLKKARLCLCNLPFAFKGERKVHLEKFHPDAFDCNVCHESFLTKLELMEHVTVHGMDAKEIVLDSFSGDDFAEDTSWCENCPKGFLSEEELLHHQTHHLKNVLAETSKNAN